MNFVWKAGLFSLNTENLLGSSVDLLLLSYSRAVQSGLLHYLQSVLSFLLLCDIPVIYLDGWKLVSHNMDDLYRQLACDEY